MLNSIIISNICHHISNADISTLASCQNLESLNLCETKVLDYSPLASCKKLRSISCFDFQITQQQRNHLMTSIPDLVIAEP
jgi:hypothetical protein